MIKTVQICLAAAILLAAPAAHADVTGDAVKGKGSFATACKVCHSPEAGKNLLGPSLFGVVGRTAGTVPGFKYSDAMKAGGKWTPEKLDTFLADPRKSVPGNVMPYAGVKDAQKRADILAYLKTLK